MVVPGWSSRRLGRLAGLLSLILVLGACGDARPTPPPGSPLGPASPGVSSAATDRSASTSSLPDASAGPPGSPGLPPESDFGAPTSADLIKAAVAEGTLDEATGVLYRVYATFGDPRLPAAYATGTPHEDVVALMRAVRDIDAMPPAIAAELRPYLARPTDPLSPFFDVAAGSASAGVARLAAFSVPSSSASPRAPGSVAVSCDPGTHWGWAVGAHRLKVWGRCGDVTSDGQIQTTVALADDLWEAEKSYLGGREPIEDAGTADQGGDTRIDIYLVSNCIRRDNETFCHGGDSGATFSSQEFIIRHGARASSAFILINRARLANPVKLKNSLAHELFHAFEFSFNQEGFLNGDGAEWLLDASATWAEWRFVPESAATEIVPVFAGFQGAGVSLQSTAAGNAYQSFAWPLFMEQQLGAGTVARAWAAIEGKPDQAQIMDAVDGVFPFEQNLRIFALRAWNEELGVGKPVEPLLPAEPVSFGRRLQPRSPRAGAPIDLKPTAKGAAPRRFNTAIPTLYGRYQPFSVDDDVGRIVLDFSGLAPADLLDVDALVKVRGEQTWQRRELPDGKTTWCMDNEKDDIERFIVVLSDHSRRPGQEVHGTWTVESPAEPCLSYHIKITWVDTWSGVADGLTFDGYADTVDPNAVGGAILLTGSGTVTGTREAWRACNPGLEEALSGTASATFQALISGDIVTVSAFGDGETIFGGSQTWPFEVPRTGGEATLQGTDPNPGTVCPHGYSGRAVVSVEMKP